MCFHFQKFIDWTFYINVQIYVLFSHLQNKIYDKLAKNKKKAQNSITQQNRTNTRLPNRYINPILLQNNHLF